MLTGIQLFAKGTWTQLKDTVTYETVFDINDNHKDGYQVGRYIVDMPDGTAQLCDKRKVKLRGLVTVHNVTSEDLNGENGVMQGRVGHYSTFYVISLSVWDKRKKTWKLVYTGKNW